MDPVTVITGALVSAVANLADPIVRDAYSSLKAMMKRKFSQNPLIPGMVDEVETDAENYLKPLQAALNKVGAGDDSELVEAAQRLSTLIEQTKPQGSGDSIMFTGGTQQVGVIKSLNNSGSGSINFNQNVSGTEKK